MLPELQALLEAAAEAGARKALESCTSQPCALIPIKEAEVSHRAILKAEKDEELRVYRRGKAAFVRRDELENWILRAPKTEKPADAGDEIGDVIRLNQQRRRRAG